MEKACSVFLSALLLISVLSFPFISAGRVLLGSPQAADGRNKIDVHPSPSKPAQSATGQVPPSGATPSGAGPANRPTTTGVASKSFSATRTVRECRQFNRNCTGN